KNKLGNRRAEQLLGTVEALSAADLYFGGKYDAEGLNREWRKTLHNQFHDILPGSSIGQVYDGTDVDYAEINAFGENALSHKLTSLAAHVNSKGGTLVYNPTGFARRDGVRINGTYCELAEEIPAFGWSVVNATVPSSVRIDGLTAENQFYVLRLGQNGQIQSLFDKRVQREVFRDGRPGNVLAVFDDHPTKYDAWELEEHYKLKRWELNEDATVTPVSDGTRAGFRIERSYLHSTIVQTLWLYSQSSRIDMETHVDWHEKHQVLKAFFPLNVHATSATYDVQFGHVTRPTHRNTSWDKSKFEAYAHKWVDVAENGYGVALLNDCKYGYSARGSELSITLLKCATFPDPNADQGEHHFTYSLMPHVGDFREAGVIREAWSLNQPLMSRPVSDGKGSIPAAFSLVSCNAKNAVITAVKKAEADDGLIVRLYDAFDCKSNVTLTVPTDYTKAYLCDLLEREEQALSVQNGSVTLPLSNFEILTVKFQK
ncbi:MAG: alpha-mannosidase, partial [Clostridia bacterium]|nr:alpha-mannosidase [Clostridia bacterium]